MVRNALTGLSASMAVALLVGLVHAQPPAQPKPAAPQADGVTDAARKMERIMALWEQQSATIQGLDAQFTRIDESNGALLYFKGRALLKSPNLAVLEFQKADGPQLENPRPYDRWVCTGDEIWRYIYSVKTIEIYKLQPDEKQRMLEEGPLPFLFNFEAARAKKRYKMKLHRETPQSYYIQILPIDPKDKAEFEQAVVKLGHKDFMPQRIYLKGGKDQKETQDFQFKQIARNPANLPDALFKGVVVENWKVIRQNPNAPAANANPKPDGANRKRG